MNIGLMLAQAFLNLSVIYCHSESGIINLSMKFCHSFIIHIFTLTAGDSYGSIAPVEDHLGTRKRYPSASSVPSLAQ